jgi:hypothetical protein
VEELLLMQTQDVGYASMKRQVEAKVGHPLQSESVFFSFNLPLILPCSLPSFLSLLSLLLAFLALGRKEGRTGRTEERKGERKAAKKGGKEGKDGLLPSLPSTFLCFLARVYRADFYLSRHWC